MLHFLKILIFFSLSLIDYSIALIPDREVLCPGEPKNGGTYLFHEETEGCYLSHGKHNPCGQMMRFYQDRDDPRIGLCDCNDAEYSEMGCAFVRPKLYFPEHRRCYPAFDQGPCENTEWLILRQGRAICFPRHCPLNTFSNENEYWFEDVSGKCRKSYSLGLCQNFTILVYKENTHRPECSERYLHYGFFHLVRDRIEEILRQNQNSRYTGDRRDIFLGLEENLKLSCSRPEALILNRDPYITPLNKCKPGGKLFIEGKCRRNKRQRQRQRQRSVKKRNISY